MTASSCPRVCACVTTVCMFLRKFDICQEISFYGWRWGGEVRQNPLKKFEDPVQLKKFPTPLAFSVIFCIPFTGKVLLKSSDRPRLSSSSYARVLMLSFHSADAQPRGIVGHQLAPSVNRDRGSPPPTCDAASRPFDPLNTDPQSVSVRTAAAASKAVSQGATAAQHSPP